MVRIMPDKDTKTMLTREELEKREYDLLAPYAMKSAETEGRQHEEKEHPYRTVYQRDKVLIKP
ncbi:hypothetical protein ACFL5C_02060 [Candidatus Omnitrophota bacterium]